jgi:hypothetical protein
MKQITEEQLQQVINVLAEIPAKHSYNAIYMLQNLPVVEIKE